MPKLIYRLPRARLHKPSGLARVRIDGRDHYLGRFGTPEAKEAYEKLIAEYLAAKKHPAARAGDHPGPAIVEVINAHREHAGVHYRRPDGSPTGEAENYRLALRPLRQLYGRLPASQFGPLELQAVRESMIRGGKLCRRTINARISRIRRVFKWAVSRGMVPVEVHQSLGTVSGLLSGRTKAREAADVGPVDEARVEKSLPYMSGPVAAMVRIQLLTGCRVGEVLIMRGADLERGEGTWAYTPSTHKNAWRGQGRAIFLGKRAQAVLVPFLERDPQAYLFSPRDVVSELRRQGKGGRSPRSTAVRYDRRTYRQAIVRACRKAEIEPWSPLQLRHTAGTSFRARFGIEATQAILGHSRVESTQVYAERNAKLASGIMAEIG